MADNTPAPAPAPTNATASPSVTPATTEKPTTCAQCNKRLDRKKQYYRNGRYFCNKRCWRTALLGAASSDAA